MPFAVIVPQIWYHAITDNHQHRHQNHGNQRQQRIQQEHNHRRGQNSPRIDEKVRNSVYKKDCYFFRIIRYPGHQTAGLSLGIETDRQPPHRTEHLTFQRRHHFRRNLCRQNSLQNPQSLKQHFCRYHGKHQPGKRRHKASCRNMQKRQKRLVLCQNSVIENRAA